MNMSGSERRRSDRLWLTVPLRFESVDSNGVSVELDGRAVSLSRHGARVQYPLPLGKGQAVVVRSPIGHHEAQFRVVESIVSAKEKNGEYGMECVNEDENFWGIDFPTRVGGDGADAKALLECRICHNMALVPLSLSEVEALRSIGKVGISCHHCKVETPWSYAEVRVRVHPSHQDSHQGPTSWITSSIPPLERGHRRVYMQVPLGLRDSRGSAEVTKTENISKCGFCFTSEKKYLTGEIVMSVFPLDPVSQKTELPARIVREQNIEGSGRRFYGATFEPQTSSKPLVA
ncbi:MAG TPA: PilZ domain-containing protein [Terriglobia bacterium]|nr:PilZ domain-containing protein [Terriglobia bacterium]